MNDFLINLAARILNQAPMVQPRLATLYEPRQIRSGNNPLAPLERESVGEYLLSAPPKSEVMRALPRTLQEVEVSSVVTREPKHHVLEGKISGTGKSGSREQSAEATSRNSSVMPTITATDEINFHSSVLNGRSRVDPGRLRDKTQNHVDASQPISTRVDGGRNPSELSLLESSPAPQREVNSLNGSDTIESNEPARVQTIIAQSNEVARAAAALIQKEKLSVAPTRMSVVETPKSEDGPASITVTIGRVDVRAVFQQPTVARTTRARQPAAMSLEEYLKQRNEGRR